MIPFWWKLGGIIAVIAGLGLWIESLRLTIATQALTIQADADATKLAQATLEAATKANALRAKEISDANDAQVHSMAGAITTLLLRKPAAGLPTAPAREASALSLAHDQPPGQPGGPDHPDAGCPADVLAVGAEGWRQVKLWREWAHDVSQ
jgi:hypothetical protein